MKALIVNHRYFPFHGGSEIYVQNIARWLAQAGWDVRVVTSMAHDLEYFWDHRARSIDAPGREMIDAVQVERLAIRHWPAGRVAFGGLRRLMGEASRFVRISAPFSRAASRTPQIPDLRDRLLADDVPDLIIATNLGLEGLAIEALSAARRRTVPLVLLPFAHLGDGSNNTALRYVSMPHHRELLRAANLVLTMTELEAKFAIDAGARPHRVASVGAGVWPSEVTGGDPKCLRLLFGQDSFIVGSIGAVAADKGACDLVEASLILRRRGLPVQLILVGPELSAFRRWLKRRGADKWAWVHLPGAIDEAAKRDMLAGIDVFALPSRTESFGIVYLEAWANAKPVVAAGVGAVTEIITDGVDGLLVPYGDPGAIADALERLAKSTEMQHAIGVSGRRKVDELYTWEEVLARIGGALDRVLGIKVAAAGATDWR